MPVQEVLYLHAKVASDAERVALATYMQLGPTRLCVRRQSLESLAAAPATQKYVPPRSPVPAMQKLREMQKVWRLPCTCRRARLYTFIGFFL